MKPKINYISFVRARAKNVDENEKPSKQFCKLESYNYTSKIIPSIAKDDGTLITEQDKILEEAKSYYEKLFTSKDKYHIDINLEEELDGCELKKLNKEESLTLEGLITYTQATLSLKAMANNRRPGSDGFSADFFKMFWKNLGPFVIRSINYGYINGQLSITQRQGIITCIPKENKPRKFMKNYRPISLLNCVYKIASGAIAQRIKAILPKLIHSDHTGFMHGRFMGENTRQLYDLMHYAETNNIPGLLLLVDFEKAFDSISWKFIDKVFKFFTFGESIITWIYIYYNNAYMAVNQGGNVSPFFGINRGCRQGDPISGYIFLLCAEILAIRIRNNKLIKGIQIGDVEFKLSQYADDLSTILDGSTTSLNNILDELNRFSNYSGLKVNFDKTHVIWIGSKKYSQDSIKTKWKLSWGATEFNLLGIKYHVDIK